MRKGARAASRASERSSDREKKDLRRVVSSSVFLPAAQVVQERLETRRLSAVAIFSPWEIRDDSFDTDWVRARLAREMAAEIINSFRFCEFEQREHDGGFESYIASIEVVV